MIVIGVTKLIPRAMTKLSEPSKTEQSQSHGSHSVSMPSSASSSSARGSGTIAKPTQRMSRIEDDGNNTPPMEESPNPSVADKPMLTPRESSDDATLGVELQPIHNNTIITV